MGIDLPNLGDAAILLPLVWAGVLAFGVMMYVVLDGFDLGVGVLLLTAPPGGRRDTMVGTVAPVWDGNETWLVMGGAGMMAAFPMAYAVILSGLYLPLVFMLVGLIWRGVSFEFRHMAEPAARPFWDRAFAAGSVTAAFFQGVALGAYIDGLPVVDGHYAGGAMDWLTPFSVLSGVGVVVTHALLGATWLVMRTRGPLQSHAAKLAATLTAALVLLIGVVSVWTPLTHPNVAERWFAWPTLLVLSPVPVLVLGAAWTLYRSLAVVLVAGDTHPARPFICALTLVLVGYCGLGISLWPNIIPHGVDIWTAAGPVESLRFALIGVALILPVILGYTAWSYHVFRGAVRAPEDEEAEAQAPRAP